jgi:GTP-binding protein YchF
VADLGIIGFGLAGKTTVFNAVTRGKAATGFGGGQEPNLGVVKVPDMRLGVLTEMFHPKKTTPAEVSYVDFPAAGAAFGHGQGPGSQFLNELRRMDALIHVVRAFASAEVPHPEGSIDAARDIGNMNLELAFADLALIERRLERMEAELRSAKASERMAGEREASLLRRLQEGLEAEQPIRAQQLTADEQKLIASYRFLTELPVLIVLNIGEDELQNRSSVETDYQARFGGTGTQVAAFCGKLEMELLDLSPEDAAEYRRELGIEEETGLDRAIRLSYHVLGLISFLTAGEDEVRAWTVHDGATAPQAAGKIHTDLERGFIRAEVVSYEDLIVAGSLAEARKRGVLRTEGKTYTVHDGDVVNILFNV